MHKTHRKHKTLRITKSGFGTSEIAQLCNVTPTTVAHWIDGGKLSAFLTAGKHRRVKERDLVAFMRDLRIPLPPALRMRNALQVLVVDDDKADRLLMTRIIRQIFPEARIHEAVDGFQAGHLLATLRPALVVLDLRLPGLDGFQVCETIRRDPNLKEVKVLAVSSQVDDATKNRILKKGADHFLGKDSPEVLWREILQALLEGKKSRPTAAAVVAG